MSSGGRVFVSRRIPEPAMQILRGHCEVEVWPERLPPSRSDLLAGVSGAEGLLCLLTDHVDAELLDAAPHLRVVSNYAVGYDNIDVVAASERGVAVTNTPGVLTGATADFAFALLLAAARRVTEADRSVRRGEWLTWEPEFLLGRDVHGAVLGIIGLGRIGRAVARRAAGFDMKVIYTDAQRFTDVEDELAVDYVSLEELLRIADFVSIHVPLNRETAGLIRRRQLQMMKPGTILINTSRGGIVDENALVEALREGPLAGAGLDVFDEEPLPSDHPITELDNVVLAPHLGSGSAEARSAMAGKAARNLVAVLSGRMPDHIVNPEVLEK